MKLWLEKVINSKSKTFLAFCFCFIVGSAALSTDLSRYVSDWVVVPLLFLPVIPLVIFKRKIKLRFLLLLVIFFLAGAMRTMLTYQDCDNPKSFCFFNDGRMKLSGKIVEEPSKKINNTEYVLSTSKVFLMGSPISVDGKVLVRTSKYPEFKFGDTLEMVCSLKDPSKLDTGNFRYDKYLARFGVSSVCYYPTRVAKIGASQFGFLKEIYNFKQDLNNRLARLWPEPEASLLAGILYGARSGIPKDLQENFSKTGVSHIVAVSGYNISIIVVLLMQSLVLIGFRRSRAFYIVVVVTLLFVVLSGLSASAVRAAIMGLAVLVAAMLGRGSSVFNILVFTAALMQLVNPYLVIWDVGFQLSFLATIGLVYFSPILEKIFKNFSLGIFREPLITTLSAILFTLPLMLYQFGSLSLVAPLVNLLVLWVVPLLMLVGSVALIVSFFSFVAAKIFAFAAHLGLGYVIMVVGFFGNKYWSSVNFSISLLPMIIMYGFLIWFLLKNRREIAVRHQNDIFKFYEKD